MTEPTKRPSIVSDNVGEAAALGRLVPCRVEAIEVVGEREGAGERVGVTLSVQGSSDTDAFSSVKVSGVSRPNSKNIVFPFFVSFDWNQNRK